MQATSQENCHWWIASFNGNGGPEAPDEGANYYLDRDIIRTPLSAFQEMNIAYIVHIGMS